MGFFKKIGNWKTQAEDKYIEIQKSRIESMKKRQKVQGELYKLKAQSLKGQANVMKQKAAIAKQRAAINKNSPQYDPLGMFEGPKKKSKKRNEDLFGF